MKEKIEQAIKELEEEHSLLTWWWVGRYYEEVQPYLDKIGENNVRIRLNYIEKLQKGYKDSLRFAEDEKWYSMLDRMLTQELDFWNMEWVL